MESSQKTRLVLVVCANVLLSAAVALVIWNGADKARDAKDPAPSAVETAAGTANANDSSSVAKIEQSAETSSDKGDLTSSANSKDKFPSSDREQIRKSARREAGSNDPMRSIKTASAYTVSAMDDSGLTSEQLVSRKKASSKMVSYPGFVPPPPPDPVGPPVSSVAHAAPVLRLDPVSHHAPERKMLGIKVTGIIGNKAMLLMRKEGMSRNERPEVVCLAPGEQVRNINNLPVSVLSVERDRVTLEVDGDRFIKTLPEIR